MTIQNYADNGAFAPRKIVDALRTTSDELARSLGLGKDAIQRKDRIASDRTQRRLRQMVEVLNKVDRLSDEVVQAVATSAPGAKGASK
jgi:hypothetical protein